MKLDTLRTIQNELESEFSQEGIRARTYYYFAEKWHQLDDPAELSEVAKASLHKASTETVAYHAPKSRTAWYCCPNSNCSVSLEFVSSPTINTRKTYRTKIEQVLIRASNAFRVNHNPLTLLLARDAFRARLETSIQSVIVPPSTVSAQGAQSPIELVLFALDIDHFKQINDSHGHLYGDQVLKTFGIRLEHGAAEWKKSVGELSIELGHPSGEEFLVLVRGAATRSALFDFAEYLRQKISGEPLPTDSEWAELKNIASVGQLTLPPTHERRVSASVGMAFYVPGKPSQNLQDKVAELLDQADTALYRAKAGGRDQVIVFDDILSKCGRVIEQDVGTKIVAVDIGKNVGVAVGQEFLVFPPGFTGQKKFQISDGRSTRTLGTYPRFNQTRITMFDVQPDLSFGFISDPEARADTIERGSHLEAIPPGSIGHLLPQASKYFLRGADGVRVGDIERARERLKICRSAGRSPYAVVLRFAQSETYLKLYGSAALNAALARLYRDAMSALPAPKDAGVLDLASVLIVGDASGFDRQAVADLVNGLVDQLPELRLIAGIFVERKEQGSEELIGGLSGDHAIEFARYAASDYAIVESTRFTYFDSDVAFRMVAGEYSAGLHSQALADIEKLGSLGIDNAALRNIEGLVHARQGRSEKSAELFESAYVLDDSEVIYKTNFVTAATTSSQVETALELMRKISDSEVQKMKEWHPFAFYRYAVLLARAKLKGSLERDEPRFRPMCEAALTMDEFVKRPGYEDLVRALGPE